MRRSRLLRLHTGVTQRHTQPHLIAHPNRLATRPPQRQPRRKAPAQKPSSVHESHYHSQRPAASRRPGTPLGPNASAASATRRGSQRRLCLRRAARAAAGFAAGGHRDAAGAAPRAHAARLRGRPGRAVEAGRHIALVLTASHLPSNICFVSMTRMLLILILGLRIFTEVLSDESAHNTCRIYIFLCDFVFSAGDRQRTNSQAVQIEPILRIGS